MSDFVLWGSSGHSKVLSDLIGLRGGRVVALIDNDPRATPSLVGVPLFVGEPGLVRWVEHEPNPGRFFGLVAIGGERGQDRLAIQERFRFYGLRLEPIMHPDASVSDTARIGPGTQILAHSVIAAAVSLGAGCIINHRALVDHECTVGDGVHLAPNATLCGCVTIGVHSMIGAGAVVLPRLKIGAGTIVGAGAVVTKDLPDGVVAYGNPARIHRSCEVKKKHDNQKVIKENHK